MLDRKDIQKQIEAACLESRSDPFKDKFKSNDADVCHGIIYQDLKIDSEQKISQLELFGKHIKKLRLVTGQMRKDNKYIWNGAALYIHYEDGSKVTKTINPEKYDEIFRLYHPQKNHPSLLHLAVDRDDWEYPFIEKLVKHNVNLNFPDQNGNTPAHIVMKKHQGAQQILMENKVDWSVQNNEGNTPLHLAFENNS